MSILSFEVQQIGQSGQVPKIIYIETNDTLIQVKAVGFLNDLFAQGVPLSTTDMVLISTKATPSSKVGSVSFLKVGHSNGQWSLIPQIYGVRNAAQYTTVGGAAAEAISIPGVLATDLAFVQLVAPGSNTVSVSYAVVTANTLTVTFSGNPGSTAIINYQIIRT